MTRDCAPLHGEDNLKHIFSLSSRSDAFPKSPNRGIECPMTGIFPMAFSDTIEMYDLAIGTVY